MGISLALLFHTSCKVYAGTVWRIFEGVYSLCCFSVCAGEQYKWVPAWPHCFLFGELSGKLTCVLGLKGLPIHELLLSFWVFVGGFCVMLGLNSLRFIAGEHTHHSKANFVDSTW